MQNGPVWIIDGDAEDRDIVQEIWQELALSNELVFLNTGKEAFQRMGEIPAAPFIIVCEVNLPDTDGLDLRQKFLATNNKKFKSVPFIFWSAHASEAQITRAYDLAVHGFFIKEGSFSDLKETFHHIIHYWLKSRMPSKGGEK